MEQVTDGTLVLFVEETATEDSEDSTVASEESEEVTEAAATESSGNKF